MIPNKELSVRQGGIKASGWAMEGSTIASMYFEALAKQYHFSLDTPIKDLPAEIVHLLLYGTPAEDKNQKLSGKMSTAAAPITQN